MKLRVDEKLILIFFSTLIDLIDEPSSCLHSTSTLRRVSHRVLIFLFYLKNVQNRWKTLFWDCIYFISEEIKKNEEKKKICVWGKIAWKNENLLPTSCSHYMSYVNIYLYNTFLFLTRTSLTTSSSSSSYFIFHISKKIYLFKRLPLFVFW